MWVGGWVFTYACKFRKCSRLTLDLSEPLQVCDLLANHCQGCALEPYTWF